MKTAVFLQAAALQSIGRNRSPAPELVPFELTFPTSFFSGGVLFSRKPVPKPPPAAPHSLPRRACPHPAYARSTY